MHVSSLTIAGAVAAAVAAGLVIYWVLLRRSSSQYSASESSTVTAAATAMVRTSTRSPPVAGDGPEVGYGRVASWRGGKYIPRPAVWAFALEPGLNQVGALPTSR